MPYFHVIKKPLLIVLAILMINSLVFAQDNSTAESSANPLPTNSSSPTGSKKTIASKTKASPILKNTSEKTNSSQSAPTPSSPNNANALSTPSIPTKTNEVPTTNSNSTSSAPPPAPSQPALPASSASTNSSSSQVNLQEPTLPEIPKNSTQNTSTNNSLNNAQNSANNNSQSKKTKTPKKSTKPKKNKIVKNKKTPPIVKKVEEKIISKKFITESGRSISQDYFLQITPKKSCDNLTNTECFRRDRKSEEPYFHKTVVSIFKNRIVAEQYFTSTNPNKKIFLKVNDGDYQLKTTNDNLISFTVNNGLISDLVLVSGNITRETLMASKCVLAEKYYGFFTAYNKPPKISESTYFSNKNNTEGVRNLIIFSDIDNIENLTLENLMAVEVKAYNNIVPVENLNLCKRTASNILDVREISQGDCKKRQECLILLNSNPDFGSKIVDESCLGYFDSTRQDWLACSKDENCNDYTVIKDCQVKVMESE